MTFLGPQDLQGADIGLVRTNPRHIGQNRVVTPQSQLVDADRIRPDGPNQPAVEQGRSFADLVFNSLSEVNDLEQTHTNLAIQAQLDPQSVDVHDLTVAAAKAQTAISITRNVVDRVLQAYREIINLR